MMLTKEKYEHPPSKNIYILMRLKKNTPNELRTNKRILKSQQNQEFVIDTNDLIGRIKNDKRRTEKTD